MQMKASTCAINFIIPSRNYHQVFFAVQYIRIICYCCFWGLRVNIFSCKKCFYLTECPILFTVKYQKSTINTFATMSYVSSYV